MRKFLLPLLLALALVAPPAMSQPGPGPGPGPIPNNPWTVNGNTVSYPGGVLLPSGVLGGNKGPGTINASQVWGVLHCMSGASSGSVCMTAPAVAGAASIVWGTGNGTPVVTASAPLLINATTGNITCATCLTGNQTITISGDVSGTGTTAITATINANAVTNAKLATMGAYTFKGNNTGGNATPTDVSIPGLTLKAVPSSGDRVLITDSLSSDAWRYTTAGALATVGTVGSFNTRQGAVVSIAGDYTYVSNKIAYPPRFNSVFQTTFLSSTSLSFGVGSCRDSTDSVNIIIASGQSKGVNSTWAPGTGNGALQSGLTFSGGTFYYLYVIYRADTGVSDFFVSDNQAPTLPASYTNFCRFGVVLTEAASAQVRLFVHDVSTNTWWLSVPDLITQAVNTTPLLLSTKVPPIQGIQGIFNASAFSLTTNYGVCIRPGFSPCQSTNQDGYTVASSVAGKNSGVQIRVPVNSSRQISVVGCPATDGCSTNGVLQTWLLGWQDNF